MILDIDSIYTPKLNTKRNHGLYLVTITILNFKYYMKIVKFLF